MNRVDAEIYLRIAGERALLGLGAERQRPWDSPLAEPASALVAVGAISAAKARAVIDDYGLTEAVRSEQGQHHWSVMAGAYRSGRRKAKPLKPRRVVPCDRTVDGPNGSLHVRHVTLAEDVTSLAVQWRPNVSGQNALRQQRQMVRFGHGAPPTPPHPQLADEYGTKVGTGFSGGGSDQEWTGYLTADRPLAPDTDWLEIDGTRLELTGEALRCEVSIEPLPDEPAANRYLWRRLAASNEFHGPPEIEGAIDALLAAGAVDANDPVVSEVRAVREALPHHPGMHATTPGVKRLPEPWRTVISRLAAGNGPEGAIVLSAVTPEFEGFTVAVSYLESEPGGFAIEVEAAPGFEGRGPFRRRLEPSQLAWWAADDRDNHYLGHIGSSSGGDDHSTGTINFWPALHPNAKRLAIMPTAEATRSVISFPLLWSRPGSGEPAEAM